MVCRIYPPDPQPPDLGKPAKICCPCDTSGG
jgi:hypothetical protein